MTLKELLELGGWAVWPLMVFSVITVTLILERAIFLAIHNLNVKEIRDEVISFIVKGDLQGAKDYTASLHKRTLCGRIIQSGLEISSLGEHRMEKAMETESAENLNKLENGFDILVAVGSIAPITGFLGTVSGMIGAFKSIANAADVNAQLVAGGIFEALITTAFGLIIAIVAISAYNIFIHIVDKFTARVEEASSSIVTRLLHVEKEDAKK